MKRLVVLGSTGTIGRLTLEVAAAHPDRFQIVGLAAGRNFHRLSQQIRRFRPRLAALDDPVAAADLKSILPPDGPTEVLSGQEGLLAVAAQAEADLVVSAVVGFAGLRPTLAALEAGKRVALANKESLVAAGALVMAGAKKAGVDVFPIDSEHSAIFQSLVGHDRKHLKRIILTASGGALRGLPLADMAAVTPAQALAHPNWDMGPRITIDSATMMNKGLEAIEASWLFGLSPREIEIVIHPQSIVHSAVEFIDGSVVAQLAVPDMRLPIAYALAYPARLPLNGAAALSLPQVGQLTFEPPDLRRFPCLALALAAAETGRTAPAVLNAADEVAVAAFLAGRIGFLDIARVVEETLNRHRPLPPSDLETILSVDCWARQAAQEAAARLSA